MNRAAHAHIALARSPVDDRPVLVVDYEPFEDQVEEPAEPDEVPDREWYGWLIGGFLGFIAGLMMGVGL